MSLFLLCCTSSFHWEKAGNSIVTSSQKPPPVAPSPHFCHSCSQIEWSTITLRNRRQCFVLPLHSTTKAADTTARVGFNFGSAFALTHSLSVILCKTIGGITIRRVSSECVLLQMLHRYLVEALVSFVRSKIPETLKLRRCSYL